MLHPSFPLQKKMRNMFAHQFCCLGPSNAFTYSKISLTEFPSSNIWCISSQKIAIELLNPSIEVMDVQGIFLSICLCYFFGTKTVWAMVEIARSTCKFANISYRNGKFFFVKILCMSQQLTKRWFNIPKKSYFEHLLV